MTLEVRDHEHRVVVGKMITDEVFLDNFAVWNVENHIFTIGIHDVDIEVFGPTVIFDEFFVLFGAIADTFVGSIALDDSAFDVFDDRAHEFWMKVVLIASFARVHLDGNFTWKGKTELFVNLDDVLGSDIF